MKEIVLALKDSIESRVKNKVVASFLIAWILFHWKGISVLILSEKKDMINIIRGYEFTLCDDLLIPLFYGVMYITVFQLIIYAAAFLAEITENYISKLSAKNAIKKLTLQRRMNNIAILSDYEYQKEVKKERLRATRMQNDALESQVNSLQESLSSESALRKKYQDEQLELTQKLSGVTFKIVKSNHELSKMTLIIKKFMDNIENNNSVTPDIIRAIVNALSHVDKIMPKEGELGPFKAEVNQLSQMDTILSPLSVKPMK